MRATKLACMSSLLFGLASPVTQALTIEFNYDLDAGFFSNTTAKNLLESAGQYFSGLLLDDLDSVVINSTVTLPGAGSGTAIDITSPADTLTVFVGGVALGENTLGLGGPVWSTATDFRGETGHTNDPATATDFAPWYGRVSFNSGRSDWYFDPDLSTDSDLTSNANPVYDFYSVALHELGHVLGIGLAPSWDHWVNSADNTFSGPASMAGNGGNLIALTDDHTHWMDDTMNTIAGLGSFEAAMDPTIYNKSRKLFTDLDIAALKDIGWEVTAVPLPPALWLFATGLLALGRFRRTKRTY